MARLLRTIPVVSRLSPPMIITAADGPQGGIGIEFDEAVRTPHEVILQRRAHSHLSPPVVVAPGIAFDGPGTLLAASSRNGRRPFSKLSPPPPLNQPPALAPPIRVTTGQAVQRPRVVMRGFPTEPGSKGAMRENGGPFPPAVIGPGIYYPGVLQHLAPSSRGKPKSHLSPPPTVGAGIYFRGDLEHLAYSIRGKPRSFLRPMGSPAVVYAPVVTHLAPSSRGKPKSRITPPAIVGAGITYRGIQQHLAVSRRGTPKSRLGTPTVLASATSGASLQVKLVAVRTGTEQSKHHARPFYIGPLVIFQAQQFGGIRTSYVRVPPRKTRSFLLPPAVAPTVVSFSTPERIALVRIRPVRTHPVLHTPAVVGAGVYFRGILVHRAPSTRGKPKSHLAPPAVTGAGIYFRGVLTHLSYSRRGTPRSVLHAPIIPPLAAPINRTLVKIRPARVYSILRDPVVVGSGIFFRGDLEHLTYSVRGKPKSRLAPPAVVGDGIFFRGVLEHLTYSVRGKPKSILRPPVVIAAGVYFRGILTHLAPSTRGKPSSHLSAPVVVGPGIYFPGIPTTLAPQRRGLPKSFLHPTPPALELVAEAGIRFHLAPSFRGKPKSVLHAPTVVRGAVELHGPSIALAYSLRGKPKSHLSRPVVVFPFVIPVIDVELATGRSETEMVRRAPKPFYIGPRVVLRPQQYGGINTQLVNPSPERPRRAAHSRLSPPSVVTPKSAIPARRQLVRIRPVKTHSFLRPPTVVTVRAAGRIKTQLVRIRPAQTHTVLRKPAVIRVPSAGLIRVHLAPSSRLARRVHPRLRGSLLIQACYGDVVGTDRAAAENNINTSSPYAVTSSIAAQASTTSSTEAASTVTGSDRAAAENDIGDAKREGC